MENKNKTRRKKTKPKGFFFFLKRGICVKVTPKGEKNRHWLHVILDIYLLCFFKKPVYFEISWKYCRPQKWTVLQYNLRSIDEWTGTLNNFRQWLPGLTPMWLKHWGCEHCQPHTPACRLAPGVLFCVGFTCAMTLRKQLLKITFQ